MSDYASLKWRAARNIITNGTLAAAVDSELESAEIDYSGTNGCQVAKCHLIWTAGTAEAAGTVSIYQRDSDTSGGTFDTPKDQRFVKSFDPTSTTGKVTFFLSNPGPYTKILLKVTSALSYAFTDVDVTESRDSYSDTTL